MAVAPRCPQNTLPSYGPGAARAQSIGSPVMSRLALGSFLAVWLSAAAPAAERPNVVLILADDLGWADLGCYGNRYHETPRLDRLAAQGLRLTDFYAAAPVCSPTRAAIMSGPA